MSPTISPSAPKDRAWLSPQEHQWQQFQNPNLCFASSQAEFQGSPAWHSFGTSHVWVWTCRLSTPLLALPSSKLCHMWFFFSSLEAFHSRAAGKPWEWLHKYKMSHKKCQMLLSNTTPRCMQDWQRCLTLGSAPTQVLDKFICKAPTLLHTTLAKTVIVSQLTQTGLK